MEVGTAIVGGEGRLVEGPAGDLELTVGLDALDGLVARHHRRDALSQSCVRPQHVPVNAIALSAASANEVSTSVSERNSPSMHG